MTELPITFTCTCKGTKTGCGTLELTDDVNTEPDVTADVWDADTTTTTKTGTFTFKEGDKGPKKFACGSDTQSNSNYAESDLDVVG